jgi:hypothetical protein
MIIDQVFKKKYLVVVVLLTLAAISLAIGLYKLSNQKIEPGTVEKSTEQENWTKYTNKDFNFTISFPDDWKVYEDLTNSDSPKINIYKPKYKNNLPFDNFSPETNISVFPKGLPTDAVMGKTQDVNFSLKEKTSKSFDYVLKNNLAWASYISFLEAPKAWQSWGFIWLNSEIKNLKYSCKSGQKEVELEACNTFEGDILERQGVVDKEIRDTQLKILSTFNFID